MDIYYEEKGNLKEISIVFIHGGAMSGEMWRSHLEYFKDYHCIIVDLTEHGKSVNLKPFNINDSAVFIANIIKNRAKGGKAHVIGHSLGAIVLVQHGLDTVRVPTLLIAGEKKHKFLKELNRDLSRILAKSTNILIKGAGHSYPWLDSFTFIRVVTSWINDKEIIDDLIISVK